MHNKNHPLNSAVVAFAVFVICTLVLFAKGGRGLGDNGDFARVMEPMGISYIEQGLDNRFVFVKDYKMEPAPLNPQIQYSSTHFIPIFISKVLNSAYNSLFNLPPENYNIFWLGFIYVLMLSGATYFIMDYLRHIIHDNIKFILMALLFLICFCDEGYILYFNSFFGEGFAYVLLMLSVGFYLQALKGNKGWLVLFYLTIALFASSKLANLPLALILSFCGLWHVFSRGKGFYLGSLKEVWTIWAAFLACVVFSLVMLGTTPQWMEEATNYHSVFFGILKGSKNPKEDLRKLELPEEFAQLANTTYYLDQYPLDIHDQQFKDQFNISKTKIMTYYLTNPQRLWEKLDVSARNSKMIRPPYLGNTRDKPLEFSNRFSLWSHIRTRLVNTPALVIFLATFLTCTSIKLIASATTNQARRKTLRLGGIRPRCAEERGLLLLAFALLGSALMAWAIPFIANGEADLPKHMFAFINLSDFLGFFLVGFLLLSKIKPKDKMLMTMIPLLLIALTYMGLPMIAQKITTKPEYVQFGNWEEKPLIWQVAHQSQDSLTLVAKEPLPVSMPFDQEVNSWENSSLRDWLNGPFLKNFSQQEKERILPTQSITVSSHSNQQQPSGGTHPFYWTPDYQSCDYEYYNSFHTITQDYVFIADVAQMKNYGIKNPPQTEFLRTPLYNSSLMVRCLTPTNLVLHVPSTTTLSIRPCLKIKPETN